MEKINGFFCRRIAMVLLAGAVLSAGLLLTPVIGITASGGAGLFPAGDVNLSGTADATDLTAMARHVAQIQSIDTEGYTLTAEDLTNLMPDHSDKEIASTELRDGQLIITYTDGTTAVAGELAD